MINRAIVPISSKVDSQAAIKALKSVNIKSTFVRTCKELIKLIKQEYTVNITWLPDHTVVEGNEMRNHLHKPAKVESVECRARTEEEGNVGALSLRVSSFSRLRTHIFHSASRSN